MRWWSIVFIAFSIFSTAHGQGPKCHEIFPLELIVVDDGQEIVETSPHLYRYRDITYGFLFEASVESGVLSMEIKLTNEGYKSSHSYEKLYDIMMSWFGSKNISMIVEVWDNDTNHAQFYKAYQSGFSEADAALQTDAGQQAARFGFTDVHSLRYSLFRVLPDAFPDVTVEFVRPARIH